MTRQSNSLRVRSPGLRSIVHLILVTGLLGLLMAGRSHAAEAEVEDLLNRAQAAGTKGEHVAALALADRAVAAAPKYAQAFYVRGRLHAAAHHPEKAVADFTRALEIEPRAAEIYQWRGVESFKLARFQESVADFDKFLEFMPAREPHHWQRGISQYYAGQYARGRQQFELHQKVNTDDVENAAWHFLCVARSNGVEKARSSLLPVGPDRRVPMAKIYELYAGRATPAEVLAAVNEGEPGVGEKLQRNFYAHLYIGLHYDVAGDSKLAREYIEKAAEVYPVEHYMGDVARVHARLLKLRTADR